MSVWLISHIQLRKVCDSLIMIDQRISMANEFTQIVELRIIQLGLPMTARRIHNSLYISNDNKGNVSEIDVFIVFESILFC